MAQHTSDEVISFIVNECYPALANHPMFLYRDREFSHIKSYAATYGFEVDEVSFENAIAERFGDGCEYEWAEETRNVKLAYQYDDGTED